VRAVPSRVIVTVSRYGCIQTVPSLTEKHEEVAENSSYQKVMVQFFGGGGIYVCLLPFHILLRSLSWLGLSPHLDVSPLGMMPVIDAMLKIRGIIRPIPFLRGASCLTPLNRYVAIYPSIDLHLEGVSSIKNRLQQLKTRHPLSREKLDHTNNWFEKHEVIGKLDDTKKYVDIEISCQTGDSLDASLPTDSNDNTGRNSSHLPATLLFSYVTFP
jgi:hypothetical protein